MPSLPTDDATLRTLEFDRVVAAVRSFALTPIGRTAVGRLAPKTDLAAVAETLRATTEIATYLDVSHPLPLEAPDDLEATISVLAIDGRPLDAVQLLGLARFLRSVTATAKAIRTAAGAADGPGRWPVLQAAADGLAEFDRETANIQRRITPEGEVADDATPRLAAIRQQLQRLRQRLRGTLESYLRGRETAKYLQEQVVTERAGRFVLLVRAEHRSAIPGIVHGSSGSGASLFLEPLSTVEINNEIVALEEEERQEVHRILLDLSNAFRTRPLELRRTLQSVAELDLMQARARFSRLIDGVEPKLSADLRIELPAARHPLLMPAVVDRAGTAAPAAASSVDAAEADSSREELAGSHEEPGRSDEEPSASREGPAAPGGPVPVDILLTPPTGALMVTGPNTGGKTVALKTAGLLALMAQAGLHVPAARGASLPVFRSLFADIGDEQSIANSLSTFSGHVAHIVAMDARLRTPALVLLDEVGAGTDPLEGGALGAAIVDHFRQRGALVLATTHDDMLKSYAATTEGVVGAGFGFDPETYAPTYRLTYGSPGRSLALEIATRLGVTRSIIEDARARRSAREAQLADHLAQVERDLAQVSKERDALAAERRVLEHEREQLAASALALKEREATARERLRSGVDAELRKARRDIDAIVGDLRKRSEALEKRVARKDRSAPPVSTGHTGALKKHAVDALDTIAGGSRVATSEPPPNAAPPVPGTRVQVAGLGLDGILATINGNDAEVEALGKRIHVRVRDLRPVGPAAADSAARGAGSRSVSRGGVTVNVAEESAPPLELNLIGFRVDEALARVEKYVDRAMLHERRELRIVHGHGTGQLRRAIAEFLTDHPLVEKYSAAAPEHGGSGVTVIALKD
ncbi:MAG: hypothetical protein F4Y45_03490 [Acidobacteria bacterium]|nr:hypothetical protein [Acidobacteriota bacterium]MYJ02901.1 hypothetical protein [Acidobacteriota bacterium]